MARKTSTFKIEGRDKPIELKELTVKEIINLIQGDYGNSLEDLKCIITKFLPLCSNLSIEDFNSMTPSELEIIWSKFKEVNSSFLAVSQQVGLERMLGNLKEIVVKSVTEDFSRLLADSLKKVTPESLTMDIPSS